MKITINVETDSPEEASNVIAMIGGGGKAATPAKKETAAAKKKREAAEAKAAEKAAEEEGGLEELEEEPTSEHTVESLTALGKELVELSGDTKTLRVTLNEAGIKGKTIGDCDPKFYDAIFEGVTAAIAAASEV